MDRGRGDRFPVFDNNDPAKGLGRIGDELRARYSLGFAPAREPDGRSHALRVEVRRKGLRVRHRASYLHAELGEEQLTRTLAALFFGYEEDTLGATATAKVAAAGAGPVEREIAVRISLPLARLAPQPDGDGRTGRVRIVVAVRRRGASLGEAPSETREKVIDVPLGTDATGAHEIVIGVPLAGEEPEIAVGVRDVMGSAATYERVPVGN